MQNYPVQLRLRIDWSEMDLFGHVNNLAILKYVQSARINYWEQIGLDLMHKEENLGPMLFSTGCKFRKPLFYPGTVKIGSRMDYIRNTSFCLVHQIFDDKGEIVAEAEDVIVMFDYNTHQKIIFPKKLRDKAELVEGRMINSEPISTKHEI